MPTEEPDLDNLPLGFSSQLVLGCVKLTNKINHFSEQLPTRVGCYKRMKLAHSHSLVPCSHISLSKCD